MAAGSLGVFRPPGLLADLLLGALVALLGVAFLLARRSGVRDVVVRRRVPAAATKGEAAVVVHEVENTGARVVRDLAVAEPAGGDSPSGLEARTFFGQLRPGTRAEAFTRLFLGRRGRLTLPGVVLRHGDPFGLFRVEEARPLPAEVLVRPRPRRADGRAALTSLHQRGPGLPDPGWDRVREWRHGDPVRAVHWRLTARRGYPVVKVAPAVTAGRVTVVLDRRLDGAAPNPALRFERAVALAAGLGLAALERGQRLRFLAPGAHDDLVLESLEGRVGADRLLGALALIRPDDAGLLAAPADLDLRSAAVVASSADRQGTLGARAALLFLGAGGSREPVAPGIGGAG